MKNERSLLAVEHTCGHTWDHKCPTNRQREKGWFSRLKRKPCPECQQAEWDEQSQASGLPLIEGPTTAVCWAYEVRDHLLPQIEEEYGHIIDEVERSERSTVTFERRMNRAIVSIRTCRSAEWWIDNRKSNGRDLLRKAYEREIAREKQRAEQ